MAQPVVTALLNLAVHGTGISWTEAVGAGLVMLGLVVTNIGLPIRSEPESDYKPQLVGIIDNKFDGNIERGDQLDASLLRKPKADP